MTAGDTYTSMLSALCFIFLQQDFLICLFFRKNTNYYLFIHCNCYIVFHTILVQLHNVSLIVGAGWTVHSQHGGGCHGRPHSRGRHGAASIVSNGPLPLLTNP